MLFAVRLGLITSPGPVKRAAGCGTLFSVRVGHRRCADAGAGQHRFMSACSNIRPSAESYPSSSTLQSRKSLNTTSHGLGDPVSSAAGGWVKTEALPITGRKADSGGPVPRWPCTTRTPRGAEGEWRDAGIASEGGHGALFSRVEAL
jgi:hypothetical protein